MGQKGNCVMDKKKLKYQIAGNIKGKARKKIERKDETILSTLP
jgi:hypothetical protein